MNIWIWCLLVLLTLLRLIAAFKLPLTGDEAYYWEWSRHLALGYVDHPAAVAWTAAFGERLGAGVGFLRLGFWLCGVITTVAVADCASRLGRARGGNPALAASVAALATVIAPTIVIAFGTVSPDGPYLAGWSLALDAGTALLLAPSLWKAVATGAAAGLALESRAFGAALLFGILVALRRDRRSAMIVTATALVCVLPLLYWNATHAWVMIAFTFVGRHVDEGFSLVRPLLTFMEVVLAFGVGPAVAVLIGGFLGRREPLLSMIAWTAWPLAVLLFAISAKERVETYWFIGPYLSLAVAASVLFAEARFYCTRRARVTTLAIPSLLLAILYALIFAAFPIAGALAAGYHVRLHKAGLFDIYAMRRLGRDVHILAEQRHAVVFSDGYGLSAMVDYYGDVRPVVIGYSWQGRELRHWYPTSPADAAGLFLDKVPLDSRPDFAAQLQRACGKVASGPVLRYSLGAIPDAVFPTTWCLHMKPNAMSILRWEPSR